MPAGARYSAPAPAWCTTWLLGLAVLSAAAPGRLAGQDRIVAPDSTATIVLPPGFRPVQLETPNALLQFSDSASEVYVMVLAESRRDPMLRGCDAVAPRADAEAGR